MGRNLANQFTGDSAKNIPFGDYFIHLQTESRGPVSTKVTVDRSECFLVIGVGPSIVIEYRGVGPVLEGHIRSFPTPSDSTMWVRICGLFLGSCRTAGVDQNNRFSFPRISPGAFLVSVLSASGQVMTERADILDPASSIELDHIGQWQGTCDRHDPAH